MVGRLPEVSPTDCRQKFSAVDASKMSFACFSARDGNFRFLAKRSEVPLSVPRDRLFLYTLFVYLYTMISVYMKISYR